MMTTICCTLLRRGVFTSGAAWRSLLILGVVLVVGLVGGARSAYPGPAGASEAQDAPARPAPSGIPLLWVEPGGVASRAGLQVGDVIRQIDGRSVESEEELRPVLESAAPGQSVRLVYRRGGEERETALVLEGRYKVAYPRAERGGAMSTTAAPTISRIDGRARLDVPGPKHVYFSLSPGDRSRVWVRADRVRVEEFPARGHYARQLVYRFEGNLVARIAPDLVIRGPKQAKLVWTDGTGHTLLNVGEREQYAGWTTRWHGWGLTCWDDEAEKQRDWVGRWRLSSYWGFSPPYPMAETTASPAQAAVPEEAPARGARVSGLWAGRLSERGLRPRGEERPGPAERAGLARGDLMEAVDGREVHHPADLQQIMENSRPGQEVRIRYRRGNESRETILVVEPEFIPRPPKQPSPPAGPRPAQPVVARSGDQTLVAVRGPVRFYLGLMPALQPEISCLADEVKLVAEKQYVYHLRGNPELRLTPDITVRSWGPMALNWSGLHGSVHLMVMVASQPPGRRSAGF